MKRIIFISLLLSIYTTIFGQSLLPEIKNSVIPPPFQYDTIRPVQILKEVDIYPKPHFTSKRQLRIYNRLIRDVRKTLPYAKKAAILLNTVNDSLQNISNEKAKKEYLKKTENYLFNEFEAPLRKLTFTQGRLLIKLIDRECQRNSYNLVKMYRGGFSAFFWQGVARIFGANLKSEYDAEGEDQHTEHIVRMVERGIL